MNNIVIHGRLGKDPELKTYSKGSETGKVVNFSVAVNRRFGEETDWFNCTAFGKRAEVIDHYLNKGSEVVLRGSMQCDPYEKDGKKIYPWKLLVEDFDFCGQGNSDQGGSTSSNPPEGFEEVNDDDMPF